MFSGGCQLLVSMTGQISPSNPRFIFWKNQKPSLLWVPDILRWKFLNDHVLFTMVIICHDGVSGSHCIAKIQSRGMSKSPKQKARRGASLLANVRMTARDMPGAFGPRGQREKAGNTPPVRTKNMSNSRRCCFGTRLFCLGIRSPAENGNRT